MSPILAGTLSLTGNLECHLPATDYDTAWHNIMSLPSTGTLTPAGNAKTSLSGNAKTSLPGGTKLPQNLLESRPLFRRFV